MTMRASTRGLTVWALVAGAGVFLAAANRQSAVQLISLTVPADGLPLGCSLHSSDRFDPWVSTNPWTGTNPVVIATILERMGGVPPVPDAPLSGREAARFRLQFADGVAEAYVALYRGTTPEFVTVYAVTFDERANSRITQEGQTELTGGSRYVIGRSEIVVGGKGSPCYEAVAGHVRAIVAP